MATALFERIAGDLRIQIANGDLAAGADMPKLRDVAAQYGNCATMTVSRAFDRLASEGLIVRSGRSWVVAGQPVLLWQNAMPGTTNLDDWAADVLAQGHTPTTRTDVTIPSGADIPDRILELLELGEDGRVIVRRSIRYVDERPVMIRNLWVPITLAQGTQLQLPDELTSGEFAAFATIDLPLTALRDELTPRHPSIGEANTLGIQPQNPVQEVLRVGSSNGKPVVVAQIVYPAGTFVRIYDLPAGQ